VRYHFKYSRPPGYKDLRNAKSPFPAYTQTTISNLCRLLTLAFALPGSDSLPFPGSSLMHHVTSLALPPGYALCTGLATTPKDEGTPKSPNAPGLFTLLALLPVRTLTPRRNRRTDCSQEPPCHVDGSQSLQNPAPHRSTTTHRSVPLRKRQVLSSPSP